MQTATGIGPESFQWSPDGNDVPEDKADFYNENVRPIYISYFTETNRVKNQGFWITNGLYDLRPEIIETWVCITGIIMLPELMHLQYYAYRATGDEKYRDYVWDAFNAILSTFFIEH